ncbi:heat shock protein transcriptional repressor HspR [Nesterenkonia aerolata]|uniref:MerR family transcriptional regulator n=1 Tax=Nesterenkonia aerolata TaxID=3074079 RepID=A0ABU2DRH5_9MICC|nr:MerR family transcriptional regulator [Nesterenkonia sp. LY-0111]MDR8019081.1 MerR family transcriptional regulator [Nesterenkonia sp. LY-0111]
MVPRRRVPDPDDPRLREPGQRHAPLFVISVAAQLAEMHPQTLRQYDRIGLVIPKRQGGRHRRYSPHDVEQLREIQRLSQEGVSLEGIRRIIELENRVEELAGTVEWLRDELREAQRHSTKPRFFAVGPYGEAEPVAPGRRPRGSSRSLTRTQTRALVVWEPGAAQ